MGVSLPVAILASALIGAGATAGTAVVQKHQADKAQAATNEAEAKKEKILKEAAPTAAIADINGQNSAARRKLRLGVASTILTSPLGVQNNSGLKTKLGV